MSEKQSSEIEWLYGLEDYYKFARIKEHEEILHDFISIYYSNEPLGILKRLALKSHRLEAPIFSKHMNCYINAINKSYDIVELTSCLTDFNNERILAAIHKYDREGYDVSILNDAFSRSQIKSKLWLIQELANIQLSYSNAIIMAGWFGQLKPILDRGIVIDRTRILEVDRSACEVSDYIFNHRHLENYKVKAVNVDINNLTLHKNGYEWEVENFKEGTKYSEKYLPDLIINTSAEHMSEDWFFQIKFKEMESNPIVAIQSNNLFDIPEHINCVHSVEHMKKKFPMKEILFEGELQLKGYKRVMLIGRP